VQRPWYQLDNEKDVASPGLLIYKDRVLENIRRMLAMIGGDVSRLRPHIKTHKLSEIVALHIEHGITRFKCATIAEAEMLASAGAADILLAYQPVGPNIERLLLLMQKAPEAAFSVIVDNERSIRELSESVCAADRGRPSGAASPKLTLDTFLDIDSGMHRTGVLPGRHAVELYHLIAHSPGLRAAGLHAYDGHINASDPAVRAEACEAAFAPVLALRTELRNQGLPAPRIIAGGTPTYPFHARRDSEVDCSPGTCVLWDYGYSSRLADLDFLHAALVLTRVVSKPAGDRLCLDLGHKAIASENPHPRVHLPEIPDAKFVTHSEEHLVVETQHAARFELGSVLYGIPWHVCPTVALHSEAVVVTGRHGEQQWNIAARARRLTI
jgi:D-serine deaminase-like pyridoxal phosphate-dependent protein